MKKIVELVLPPEIAFDNQAFEQYIARKGQWQQALAEGKLIVRMLRRSIDARAKQIKVNVSAAVYLNETPEPLIGYARNYPDVSRSPQAIIVGAGPAGMFAALRLIELGIKPILIERGKDVRARRRDLAAINKDHIVNPESNYCFGEGGAGTYSDGKLYTRSKKRGDFRRILEIFVAHGANPEILVDAHPHIGTNKLPAIVTNIRESILQAGGEIYFNTKVTDLLITNNRIKGVQLHNGSTVEGIGVILATGHSARDIFYLLHHRNILIEPKPFALGVRVEHPQALIDRCQYHCETRSDFLPAASYSLVSQIAYQGITKGVFSFCMCPGGFIVPAATAPGEVVVNGMSPSRRNSRFANSGIVVAIDQEDLAPYAQYGALAGMMFQREIEQRACQIAGGNQTAPAQRLMDFVNRKVSDSLPECSYQPGLAAVEMEAVLPKQIAYRLREGFKQFGKKMKGYLTNEAQIVGVESRTSSPVRIPRHLPTLEHPQIAGLFPCGEGAGYAGGIASAAMDGERCAEMLAAQYARQIRV
ncbi:MAG: FAD-dependent monooxygenase [Cytophagales bacterium]|nr:FAD-dependent monooxygenase [Bernardetiaceae bacterium]MDW8203666.1 FAD-dependent monooxygenase [Cytophagales bacterium]